MIPLTPETERRLDVLFPGEKRVAAMRVLVERCGETLPLSGGADQDFWDRIRFAVLKLSDGDLPKLELAVAAANRDWRDTLMAAGFGESVTAHRAWFPGARSQDA